VPLGQQVQPRDQGIHRGIGPHLGRIEDEFVAAHEPRFHTLLGDDFEEAAEDGQSQPRTDLTQ
jgi:hypothetical protein